MTTADGPPCLVEVVIVFDFSAAAARAAKVNVPADAEHAQRRTTSRANAIVGRVLFLRIIHGVAHFGRSVRLRGSGASVAVGHIADDYGRSHWWACAQLVRSAFNAMAVARPHKTSRQSATSLLGLRF